MDWVKFKAKVDPKYYELVKPGCTHFNNFWNSKTLNWKVWTIFDKDLCHSVIYNGGTNNNNDSTIVNNKVPMARSEFVEKINHAFLKLAADFPGIKEENFYMLKLPSVGPKIASTDLIWADKSAVYSYISDIAEFDVYELEFEGSALITRSGKACSSNTSSKPKHFRVEACGGLGQILGTCVDLNDVIFITGEGFRMERCTRPSKFDDISSRPKVMRLNFPHISDHEAETIEDLEEYFPQNILVVRIAAGIDVNYPIKLVESIKPAQNQTYFWFKYVAKDETTCYTKALEIQRKYYMGMGFYNMHQEPPLLFPMPVTKEVNPLDVYEVLTDFQYDVAYVNTPNALTGGCNKLLLKPIKRSGSVYSNDSRCSTSTNSSPEIFTNEPGALCSTLTDYGCIPQRFVSDSSTPSPLHDYDLYSSTEQITRSSMEVFGTKGSTVSRSWPVSPAKTTTHISHTLNVTFDKTTLALVDLEDSSSSTSRYPVERSPFAYRHSAPTSRRVSNDYSKTSQIFHSKSKHRKPSKTGASAKVSSSNLKRVLLFFVLLFFFCFIGLQFVPLEKFVKSVNRMFDKGCNLVPATPLLNSNEQDDFVGEEL